MIRINLLGVERKHAKRQAGLDLPQKAAIACSVILLATVALVGWWYWSLDQQAARLEQEIAAAQQETQRLGAILEDVKGFQARRAELQQRVALIEELRNGQSAPVRLLDEVSRSVPDRLWLTELRQEDNEVTLTGRAMSLTSISDLVSNLETSGYFRRPVEIVDSQVVLEQEEGIEVVRFSVKGQFLVPGS